jgi:hypothetical protein
MLAALIISVKQEVRREAGGSVPGPWDAPTATEPVLAACGFNRDHPDSIVRLR